MRKQEKNMNFTINGSLLKVNDNVNVVDFNDFYDILLIPQKSFPVY